MKPPVLTVDDARDPAAEQVIAEGLRRYNWEQCGISDGRALNVVARDPETNAPLGGITGHTSLGVLFIDLFFLPEELRRDGVGIRHWELEDTDYHDYQVVRAKVAPGLSTQSTSPLPSTIQLLA